MEKKIHLRKLYNLIYNDIKSIKSPNVLEFGVSDKALSNNFFFYI